MVVYSCSNIEIEMKNGGYTWAVQAVWCGFGQSFRRRMSLQTCQFYAYRLAQV